MTIFVYVNTAKQVGDPEHIKVFANQHAADEWFKEHDPEGVAFGYELKAPDMKPHVGQAYKDACDNLIYLKKEQFQVTYYTWLVLAALYILSRAFPVAKEVLVWGTCAVGFISFFVLLNFQSSIERHRKRLASIYEDYFTERERKRLGLDATSTHRLVCGILSLAVLGATAFTAWVVYQPPAPGALE
ncbi:hypothetical protein V1290_002511 [Bradyrhizobium sp. AZCC 1578]|uniref:hypothetical protein n=1 Tax=Bradyrhizobium sp. AZCC 1578 TaxID=3117027 RepID=UPI002FF1DB78